MAQHVKSLLLILLANCINFDGALGLSEEPDGLFDWKQLYNGLIGRVNTFHWDQSQAQTGKKAFVASDKNVLASLNIHDGSILWCKIFKSNRRGGRIDEFLHQNSLLISIHSGGQFVRSWSAPSGSLLWEQYLSDDVESRASGLFVEKDRKDFLIVATSKTLYSLKIKDGSEEWKTDMPSSDTIERWYLAERDDGSIVAVGVTPGQRVTMTSVSSQGVISKSLSVHAPWITIETSCLILEHKHFVCYCPHSRSLQVLGLEHAMVFKQTELLEFPLTPESAIEGPVPGLGSAIQFRSSQDRLVFMILTSQETFTVHKVLEKTLACEVIHVAEKFVKLSKSQLQRKKWKSETVYFREQYILITLKQVDTKTLQLKATDQSDSSEILDFSHNIPYAQHHGQPTKMFPLLISTKKGLTYRHGCELIFLSKDYTIHFAQKNKSHWRRQEALAYILSVLMVDLPVSENKAKFEDEFGKKHEDLLAIFYKRLKAQFSQLHGFAQALIDFALGHHHHHVKSIEAIKEENPKEEDLIRDNLSHQKIIVVATAAGKLYGIQGHLGKIVWQQFFPDMECSSSDKENKLLLVVQKSVAHSPHEPLCTVMGINKSISFNAVTGKIIHETIKLHPENQLSNEDKCFDLGAELMQQIVVESDKKKVSVKKFPEAVAVAIQWKNTTSPKKIVSVNNIQESKSYFPKMVLLVGHILAICAIIVGFLLLWLKSM